MPSGAVLKGQLSSLVSLPSLWVLNRHRLCCPLSQPSLSASFSVHQSLTRAPFTLAPTGAEPASVIFAPYLCSVTLQIFIGRQFCFRRKTCVAGLGTSFRFVCVGAGCLAAWARRGPVWKGEGWDTSQWGRWFFSSVGGAAQGCCGETTQQEPALSLPSLLTLFHLHLSFPF